MNTLKLNSAGLNRVTLNTIGEVRFVSKPPIPTYTLSASVVNGVVSATLNGVAVPLPYTAKEGDVIVVSVTPTDGYIFEGWSDGNTDNPRTITMSEDVDLSAECVEDVPSYENGVYIQHINGKLYTTDEWTAKAFANADANGVAVVTDECRFVMAVNYAANVRWSNLDSVLIEGVFNTIEKQTAKTDFGGRQNSVKIAEASESSAAQICLEYTFKNGQKGYLPALGELEQLHSVSSSVNTALKAIGSSYRGTDMWSSTQRGEDRAWLNGYRYTNAPNGYKSDYNKAWPFTELK